MTSHFDKSLLPAASSFYLGELGKLGRPDRHGWAKANCPFHESKSGKSFNVNLNHGAFCCFGCDTKGGDVVSFLRKRYGMTFRRACEELGAWRDLSGDDQRRIEREQAERERKRLEAEAQAAEEKRKRIDARDFLHALERIQDQTSIELCELERKTPGVESREKDLLLADLCILCDEIREAEQSYLRLAGIEVTA